MRKKLILFSFLLCSFLAQASNTLVTATVTDTNGQAYSYGFVTATFRPTPNVPGPYTVSGASFTKTVTANINSVGTFTITLTDNHTIQPANSRWTFTVCSSASVQCFDSNVDVTGASQNLSSTLSAASTPISNVSALPGLSRAYQNTQVSGGFGVIYYNILNNVIRVNNGSLESPNWEDVGSFSICGNNGEILFNDNGVCGASSNLYFDGTNLVVAGSGSGCITFEGATSGSATLCVPAVAGTPNQINLPTTTGSAGQVLTTDGGNPQQTNWAAAGGGSSGITKVTKTITAAQILAKSVVTVLAAQGAGNFTQVLFASIKNAPHSALGGFVTDGTTTPYLAYNDLTIFTDDVFVADFAANLLVDNTTADPISSHFAQMNPNAYRVELDTLEPLSLQNGLKSIATQQQSTEANQPITFSITGTVGVDGTHTGDGDMIITLYYIVT